MAVSEQEFAQAEARSAETRAAGHAVSARYDRRRGRIVIALETGIELSFATAKAQGLAGAAPADLAEIEITPSGLGLHWPRLDADIYVPALLHGVIGSKSWMAATLGTLGGKARTTAKAAAARENGRKGGRPRKVAAR